jgi:hypothetical protein
MSGLVIPASLAFPGVTDLCLYPDMQHHFCQAHAAAFAAAHLEEVCGGGTWGPWWPFGGTFGGGGTARPALLVYRPGASGLALPGRQLPHRSFPFSSNVVSPPQHKNQGVSLRPGCHWRFWRSV